MLCFAFQLEEPPAEHTFSVETQAMEGVSVVVRNGSEDPPSQPYSTCRISTSEPSTEPASLQPTRTLLSFPASPTLLLLLWTNRKISGILLLMLKDLLGKITLAPPADRKLSSSDDYSDVLPDTCRMPLFQPQTRAC